MDSVYYGTRRTSKVISTQMIAEKCKSYLLVTECVPPSSFNKSSSEKKEKNNEKTIGHVLSPQHIRQELSARPSYYVNARNTRYPNLIFVSRVFDLYLPIEGLVLQSWSKQKSRVGNMSE